MYTKTIEIPTPGDLLKKEAIDRQNERQAVIDKLQKAFAEKINLNKVTSRGVLIANYFPKTYNRPDSTKYYAELNIINEFLKDKGWQAEIRVREDSWYSMTAKSDNDYYEYDLNIIPAYMVMIAAGKVTEIK